MSQVSDTPPGDEELEGSGVFEGSGLFEGSGEQMDSSGAEDMLGDDDEDEDAPVYYFLEESTGYMQPTLAFLAIIHTIISFICIIGYNCLKVQYTEHVSKSWRLYYYVHRYTVLCVCVCCRSHW